jgi:hypothetical protein
VQGAAIAMIRTAPKKKTEEDEEKGERKKKGKKRKRERKKKQKKKRKSGKKREAAYKATEQSSSPSQKPNIDTQQKRIFFFLNFFPKLNFFRLKDVFRSHSRRIRVHGSSDHRAVCQVGLSGHDLEPRQPALGRRQPFSSENHSLRSPQ